MIRKYIQILAILVFLGCQEEQQRIFQFKPELSTPKVEEAWTPGTGPVTDTTDIHFGANYCAVCHETPVTGRFQTLKFGGDFNQLCRCHLERPGDYIHPVNIEPSKDMKTRIPGDMPLREGKLSCTTCHDMLIQCNEDTAEKSLHRGGMFLRGGPVDRRRNFCYECHDMTRYRRYNAHKQLDNHNKIIVKTCLYCHSEKPDEQIATYKEAKLIGPLEPLCVRCHYQVLADRDSLHVLHLRKPSDRVLARMRQMEAKFGIVLPLDKNESITCATCHNPHEKGVIPEKRPGAKGASGLHRQRITGNICVECHQI